MDVLALSATPIPRTLHLSLTGMRDISVIKTPPPDRQPIVSYITPYEESVVKDAIQKELERNGQVFFVHNNIKNIFKVADNLKQLVPKARIGVAHGRLSETELEKVMMQFVHNEIDLLVCTTIIESGLDIPSANTMIIDKAERFGLSQIYQLRGASAGGITRRMRICWYLMNPSSPGMPGNAWPHSWNTGTWGPGSRSP